MAFLTLNGATFAVVDGSVNRRIRRKGKRSRAYRGQLRDGQRGRRRSWAFRACFKDHEEAETMARIINGEGHVVHFVDGFAADTGLQPELLTLSSVTWDFTVGPFSGFTTGSMVGDPFDDVCRYDPQFADDWTIMWWERVGGDWRVIANRSDGRAWLNGVEDTSAWQGIDAYSLRVEEGRVTVAGFGAEIGYMHQLVMLPFKAADTFITQWAAATKPWGGLPVLRMEGDVIATDHEYVLGEVTSQVYVQKPHDDPDFGWANNAEYVEFRLTELATEFVADLSVTSQGAIVTAVPPVPETGAFAITFAKDYGGTTGFVSFGSKSDKNIPSPTLTTLNQQSVANSVEAYLAVYDDTGTLAWVRSINSAGTSTNPRAYFEAFRVDAVNDAVYAVAVARYDQELRDENGVVLNTLTNTAGPSTINFFSCFYKFQLSTGNLLWARKNDFNTAPASGTRCRPEAIEIMNGRLYFSGIMDWDISDRSNFATFNGVNHPVLNPAGNGRMSSTWILEVDPSTGDGLRCVCNYSDPTTTANGPTYVQGSGTIRAQFLAADPARNRLHLISNHSGYAPQGKGDITIGVGDAGAFNTRTFSANALSGGYERPYLATYDADLAPIAATTLWFTAPSANPPAGAIGTRSTAARPAVLADGSIVWGFQNGGASPAPTPATIDINRDGAGGPYTGVVMPQPGNDASTVLIRTPADHGPPVWATSFAVKTNTSNYTRETCVFPNADGTRLFAVHKANGGAFNDPTSFNGTASVTQDAQQGYEVAIDVTTGAEIWKAANRRNATNAYAKGTGIHEFSTGPAAGQIWMPRYFTGGNAFSLTWGAENPDTTLGFQLGLGWDNSSVNGGTGPSTHRYALAMIARNADGTVDPDNCWPIMATNTASQFSQGFQTW